MATRRQFSREFKVEAVKLVTERGVGVSQAARDLDVGETVLRRWMRELTQDPQQAFPGKGVMKPEQAEIDRLRKEVAKLKMERDILKKAALDSTGHCNMIQIMLIRIWNEFSAERLDVGATSTFVADVEDGQQHYGYWNRSEQGSRISTHLSFTSRRHCATQPSAR